LDNSTGKRLIEQAAHDPKAFGELFEEHYDSILRYCIFHTATVEVARDITAETFYKALKNLWRYKFTGAPFSAWLYRIARNEVVTYFRKNRYSRKSLDEAMEQEELIPLNLRGNLQEEIDAAQQKLDNNVTYKIIRDSMEALPMKYRDVLLLRFVEEKKICQICEILGKKEGTVKSLISRGIVMLRELSKKQIQLHDSSNFVNDSVMKESLFNGR
jgi:RNA polymerase sigma-70 factor (ECF subfamily)